MSTGQISQPFEPLTSPHVYIMDPTPQYRSGPHTLTFSLDLKVKKPEKPRTPCKWQYILENPHIDIPELLWEKPMEYDRKQGKLVIKENVVNRIRQISAKSTTRIEGNIEELEDLDPSDKRTLEKPVKWGNKIVAKTPTQKKCVKVKEGGPPSKKVKQDSEAIKSGVEKTESKSKIVMTQGRKVKENDINETTTLKRSQRLKKDEKVEGEDVSKTTLKKTQRVKKLEPSEKTNNGDVVQAGSSQTNPKRTRDKRKLQISKGTKMDTKESDKQRNPVNRSSVEAAVKTLQVSKPVVGTASKYKKAVSTSRGSSSVKSDEEKNLLRSAFVRATRLKH